MMSDCGPRGQVRWLLAAGGVVDGACSPLENLLDGLLTDMKVSPWMLESDANALTEAVSQPAELEAHAGPTSVERWTGLVAAIVPFIGFVAAVITFWGNGLSGLDLTLLFVMYAVTMVGVGTGFHRYFTHRSFEAPMPIRVALGIAGCMAAQGPVSFWVGFHRIHHARSDSAGDPHSPVVNRNGWWQRVRGFCYAHTGWLFFHQIDRWDRLNAAFDVLTDPVIRFIDRLYFVWIALGLAIPALLGGVISGSWEGAWTGFLWGGLVRLFLVHHSEFSINSICHLFGPRPYETQDMSRNNPWIGIIAFGDGWHNNHHKFPTSAMHGLRWWQVDLNGYLILILEKLGLARNVRRPSREEIDKVRRTAPRD